MKTSYVVNRVESTPEVKQEAVIEESENYVEPSDSNDDLDSLQLQNGPFELQISPKLKMATQKTLRQE